MAFRILDLDGDDKTRVTPSATRDKRTGLKTTTGRVDRSRVRTAGPVRLLKVKDVDVQNRAS